MNLRKKPGLLKYLWKTDSKKTRVNIFGFSETKVVPLSENEVDYFPVKNRIISYYELKKVDKFAEVQSIQSGLKPPVWSG